MMASVIDPGSVENRRRAVGVLALAFAQDPMMRWIYPDASAYLEHFPEFVRLLGSPSFDDGSAWLSDDGGGAAIWFAGGVHPDNAVLGRHLHQTIDSARHPSVFQFFGEMPPHYPAEPYGYLSMIGVDPALQGGGRGGTLIRGGLERCDREGLPAYLESSNPANIPFYERQGFKVIGEIQVGDSPKVSPMLRPAS